MDEPMDMKNSSMENGDAAAESVQDSTYSWVSSRQSGTESSPGVNPWSGNRTEGGNSFWTEHIQSETAPRDPQPGFSQNREQPGQAAQGDGRIRTDGGQRDRSRQTFAEQSGKSRRDSAGRQKKPSGGRRWASLIAMALVFGLVAGSVAYGVIRIGYRIYPPEFPRASSGAEDGGEDSSRTVPGQRGTENAGSDASVPEDAASDGTDSGSSAADDPAAGVSGTENASSDGSVPEDTGSDGEASGSSAAGAPGTENAASADAAPEDAAQAERPLQAEMSVADVTENTMPSMVTISTMSVMEMQSFFGGSQKYTAKGAGTGIIVGQNDSELLIATNNHVVEGASQLSVGFIDEEAAEAVIKGTDSDADLAVIAVKLEDIPEDTRDRIKIATIGDSDALRLGEQIVVIGNALGYGQSVTSGYVSAFDRELNLSDGTNSFISSNLIQVDAAINSGNSGGALLNMKGELVGINEAKSSVTMSGATVDNVGYAIPINKAEPILEELMNETTRERYSEAEQGYLGVTCANVTAEYARMYGMPEGVCFTTVVEGGPAGEAGILKGDVLISFDGKAIRTYEALTDRLTYYKAGDAVTVVVLRANGGGEYIEHTVTVTLGDREVLEKVLESAPEEG